MAEHEMSRHQPSRKINLSLLVEGIEQGGADHLHIGREVVELVTVLPWDAGRRNIQIAGKVERHGSVHYGAHGRDVAVDVGGPDPPEHLVDRVGVGEDVVRRLPIDVPVGIAEAGHPQRRSVSEGSSQVEMPPW
jgi:hypothetical protein